MRRPAAAGRSSRTPIVPRPRGSVGARSSGRPSPRARIQSCCHRVRGTRRTASRACNRASMTRRGLRATCRGTAPRPTVAQQSIRRDQPSGERSHSPGCARSRRTNRGPRANVRPGCHRRQSRVSASHNIVRELRRSWRRQLDALVGPGLHSRLAYTSSARST
jgi:hypothetical protein